MAEKFHVPRITFHGIGSFENLKEVPGKKAIIVTGKSSMQKAGYIDKAKKILQDKGMSTAVFDGVEPDPSIETVMQGVEVFNKEQPDVIIGLGGCSAIDAAKAMWIFYEHPDYTFEDIIVPFGIKPLRNKAIFVAIPSTSGTGTEVTCASVITDRSKGIKHPIVTYEITPDFAIVDGELCKTMPPNVTADTGMDALCHACEAFVSTIADYYTDPIALKSITMIFENLPKAYENGNDLEARQVMHDASCLAGMAFTNALLGIVHAMAHQLGGMFGIPHGRANAILLPNAIRYNSKATDKYNIIAHHFGLTTAEEFATKVEELRKLVGIEDSIKEYGIDESLWQEKLDAITEHASKDACVGCNPRTPTLEDIKKIYQTCYDGEKVDF
jgi:alcohol dehydrogenase class IV